MSEYANCRKRFVISGAMAICLFAFIGPAFAQQPVGKSVDARKAWVRGDSNVIIALELARFWNGPEKDSLRCVSNLHPFVASSMLHDATAVTRLDPSDVARLIVSEEWPAGWAVAVETVETVDANRLRAALVPGVPATTLHRRSYYASDRLALCQFEPQTALIATPPNTIRSVLARLNMQPDAAVSLLPVNGGNPALLDVYLRPAAFRDAFGKEGTPLWLTALTSANYVRATFEPANELTVRLIAQFRDDATAEASVEPLKLVIAQLEKYLEMCEANMPTAVARFATEHQGAEKLGPLLDQAIKAARLGMSHVTVQRNANTVSAVISIQTTQPATDAVLLLSLVPRPMK